MVYKMSETIDLKSSAVRLVNGQVSSTTAVDIEKGEPLFFGIATTSSSANGTVTCTINGTNYVAAGTYYVPSGTTYIQNGYSTGTTPWWPIPNTTGNLNFGPDNSLQNMLRVFDLAGIKAKRMADFLKGED